jgi:hypothetical protein
LALRASSQDCSSLVCISIWVASILSK